MAASGQKDLFFSTSTVSLLLRGWNEIPEIVASSFIAVLGLGFGFAGLYVYNKNDGSKRKYKFHYTVYRPDDPRVANIKTHCGLDE
ncbi:uncharacterized protein LOC107226595 isoform X1 [Neodiprion lecontei]|uniref:Uncharacterized protein LOC107226595 isoform X1 n=1 Tax=Neodiprion lecontei TaxID=441921 RepID=A0ABM3FPB3_NEOLC|nr:uncharacterized protein LOC107226595 isoform X1 [Neodiprion lecontei]